MKELNCRYQTSCRSSYISSYPSVLGFPILNLKPTRVILTLFEKLLTKQDCRLLKSMATKDSDYRIFVGGLSWDVTERQLEDAFSRFGKIIDSQIMLERDTGRPRGFGFLTFSDRRGMEDAIREMHGSDFGERVISVNKAQPRMAGDDANHGYGGSYPSGGRGGYGGGDRSLGQDECFKCGRSGHWARDCPSAGGGGGRGGSQFSSRSRFGGSAGRGDRYADRDRYVDDRYDAGRFGDRDRYESRDRKYGSRDLYANDRYPPAPSGDRFGGDRYGASERYPPPHIGYGRERDYDREVGPKRSSDIYAGGGGGGPARYEGRNYRDRAGPYDRPRRGGGRPTTFDY